MPITFRLLDQSHGRRFVSTLLEVSRLFSKAINILASIISQKGEKSMHLKAFCKYYIIIKYYRRKLLFQLCKWLSTRRVDEQVFQGSAARLNL